MSVVREGDFPDLCEIEHHLNGYKLGILISKGGSPQSFFESVGRSVMASRVYDFVCSLFIDISGEGDIYSLVNEDTDKIFQLKENLWMLHNLHIEVLKPVVKKDDKG